jgi:hypothetical protein
VLLSLLLALFVLGLWLQNRLVDMAARIRREHEAQLLVVGDEMALALLGYRNTHSGLFPPTLEDLVTDKSMLPVRHYLRRIRPDPITGKVDWAFVRDQDGRITAVFSPSGLKPFRQDGFDPLHSAFANKHSYSDWKFAPPDPGQQSGSN